MQIHPAPLVHRPSIHVTATGTTPTKLGLIRRLIATTGSLAAAAAIPLELFSETVMEKGPEIAILFIPTILCLLSAYLLHRRYLGGQMLARATWWSNLILGTLISISASGNDELLLGLMLALGSGGALLMMGRAGLGANSTATRFHPVAFRGSLIVAMIMALADTQSLMLFGGISIFERDQSPLALICASVMLIAVFGLYRLAMWGLALNLLANIAIATLAYTGMLNLPEPIIGALVITAVLQLLLPLPLLIALVRGVPKGTQAQYNSWPLLALLISVMMLLSAYATIIHSGRLVQF